MEQDGDEQTDDTAKEELSNNDEATENGGGDVALDATASALDEPKEEVATPNKRAQRARGRGKNARL